MEYARSYYNPTIGSKETKASDGKVYGFLTDDNTQIVGTYLNWKTATAGVGKTDTNSVPNDSICPAGWQLPINDSNGKSYYNLIIGSYNDGITAGEAGSGKTYYQTKNGAYIYAMSQTLRQSPLSIPFSGFFHFHTGAVYYVASNGRFWSSTSFSAPNARGLAFGSGYLYPQGGNYKENM